MASNSPVPGKRSFSYYLMVYMVLLVLCIAVFFTINDYLDTRNTFEQESQLLQAQTEQNIEQAMRLTDATFNFFDDILNSQMKDGLNEVNAEYERAGHDPNKMDLQKIKNTLGEGYDIYLINASGMIAFTTYQPEQGLDFSTYPDFYSYLTKIRTSTGFYPDRVVRDQMGAGQFRKFAYMPTGDHQYILELGLAGKAFEDINDKLDNQKNIEKIVAIDPYVEKFRIFNTMGRRVDDNSLPEASVQGYLNQSVTERATIEVPGPEKSQTTRYLFIDLKTDQYGSDPSRIVEITYNTQKIQDALNRLLLFHILISIIAIGVGCVLAYALSLRMTRPVREIVGDVDTIARGDLDHRIGLTTGREFVVLEKSINTMVDSLKSAFRKVKDGEVFQQGMIDQLPVAVFLKQAEGGRYVYWNKTSEHLFGLSAGDVIGKTDRELFPEKMVALFEKEEQQLAEDRNSIKSKIATFKHMDGRVIHTIIAPMFDSQGNVRYMLGIAEDLTDQNINLKMDLLFSLTRHDILDQLSVIMNYLERAQLKDTRDEMQKFFDTTIRSVELIRSQISFARSLQEIGISSPKWLSVEQSFDDALRLMAENPVEIDISGIKNIELFADPLLPRVFFNLLDNSLRYGGKRLTKIRLFHELSDVTLKLVYEDNGIGIPVDIKEKIFDFGFGTETGMGLFLSREILAYTGITIKETGEPGKGARFEIEVPLDKYRFTE